MGSRIQGSSSLICAAPCNCGLKHHYRAVQRRKYLRRQAADCDIVIAILRHRLGTALSGDFARMPNGEPYPSGTAYEILTAIDAGRKRGLPDVYVFRYRESPTVRLDDRVTNALVSEQWDRLKTFFQTWFQTPSGHFTAAFQQFRTTDEFEAQVDSLLRKWLADRILKDRPGPGALPPKGRRSGAWPRSVLSTRRYSSAAHGLPIHTVIDNSSGRSCWAR
jgi:hypothetical protein